MNIVSILFPIGEFTYLNPIVNARIELTDFAKIVFTPLLQSPKTLVK